MISNRGTLGIQSNIWGVFCKNSQQLYKTLTITTKNSMLDASQCSQCTSINLYKNDSENVQDKTLSCLHHLAEQIQEKDLVIRALKNISPSQQRFTCSKSTQGCYRIFVNDFPAWLKPWEVDIFSLTYSEKQFFPWLFGLIYLSKFNIPLVFGKGQFQTTITWQWFRAES